MAVDLVPRPIPRVLLLAVAFWAAASGSAWAYTPESPEVKKAIERGLTYLQTAAEQEKRLGGQCLIGLCFYKNGHPIEHPLIQAGIKACRDSQKQTHNETYSPALALIFLCELEGQQPELRELAQSYLDQILKRQQPGGGWGYSNIQTGDTSQTQYGALAMWMAANHGQHDVPQDAVERLCGWLVRTQDPSGTWGYQGIDPGGYARIGQTKNDFRLSLHVGGIGSLYMTADMLGFVRAKQAEAESNLPPALRSVNKPEEAKRRPSKFTGLKLFDVQLARNAIADGDRFFAQAYQIDPQTQVHYYLYGLERYQSFKELLAGRFEPEPKWYNDGCRLLLASQQNDGNWLPSGDTPVTATCFSILFLARSSRKSIVKVDPNLGDGTLLGGMGLPSNVADIAERDGKIIETPLGGSIDELLALIEKPNAELDALVDPRRPLTLDSDVTKRAGQVAKMRALVSAGKFEARLLAVMTLGKARNLDNVPYLIYALTDPIDPKNPDYRIVREADRALRFLSRKFDGVGLPDRPSPQDTQAAIKAWKAWYKSVRPEAQFLD